MQHLPTRGLPNPPIGACLRGSTYVVQQRRHCPDRRIDMAPLLRDPSFRRRLDDHRVEDLLSSADECADLEQRNRLLEEAVILSLDLADAVAHRYSGRGMDIEDLTQVARMGLVKAVHRYRSGAGFS